MEISNSKSIENTPVWIAQAPNWDIAYPIIRADLQNIGPDFDLFFCQNSQVMISDFNQMF